MKDVSIPIESRRNARPRSMASAVHRFVESGAAAWGISNRSMLMLLVVPFLVAVTGVATALMGKETYKWFTGEDRIAESFQALLYALALVLCVVIVTRLWREGRRGIALLYVIVAVGLTFMVGEEVSWGQRFFGWTTPESFLEANKQGETNLHNIHGVGYAFKWLQLVVGAYGTLLPLLLLRVNVQPRMRQFLAMVVPPVTLVPYFMMLFIWRMYRNLFEAPRQFYFVVSEYNEVMELILASGFFMFMLYQLRKLNEARRSQPSITRHKTAA